MKLMRRATSIYAYIFLLASNFISCNPDKVSVETTSKAKELKNINFFLETSASMEGYMRGDAGFIKLIPNYLVDIEGKIPFEKKEIQIYYIADSIKKYDKSTSEFIRDISTTPVAKQKSSEMHRLFEMVTKSTDTNSISLFVSDCILSYPDGEIRKNREINKERVDGELKASIKQSFQKIKNKKMAASVFGFNSSFFGNYYTYRNDILNLSGSNIRRPYYLWAIGDRELMKKFKNDVLSIPNFSPNLILDFGHFDEPIRNYSLLYNLERQGEWRATDTNLSGVKISKTKPIQFAIAMDLSALPKYAQEKSFIKANANLNSKQLNATYEVKDLRIIDQSKASGKEKDMLRGATHVLVFEVTDLYSQEGAINLRMPLIYSTEYNKWSTNDDTIEDSLNGKTFGFASLVDGVREAYQNKNEDFINISITLKK